MLSIEYAPEFVRTWKRLPNDSQDEIIERIELFKYIRNHPLLKVHKLKGKMKDRYVFSINFHDRIVFRYTKDKKTAYLLDIGDHTVYT
jgi:mRNA-degrading endonuclease YafQ of YafQ-DinJ toxin-antitoxin module